jgi:UDPglucose--hexose-1-phosphate uridylyltransferase
LSSDIQPAAGAAGGPQVRHDPLSGRWTVLAAGRALRPTSFSAPPEPPRRPDSCPFCAGREDQTPPEVWSDRAPEAPRDTPGWTVRVVGNKFPAFVPGSGADGGHEVVVHGPQHAVRLQELRPDLLAAVLGAWRARLRQWATTGAGSVLVIVNEGPTAGASLEHSHSQLFASALRPPLVAAEVERLRADGCGACALAAAERAAGTRVVGAEAGLLTLCPPASGVPFEALLLPVAHDARFEARDDGGDAALAGALAALLTRLRAAVGFAPALNLVLHSAPPGEADFHWHLHILPRLSTLGGFELGSGVFIDAVDPDDAAARLRAV